MSSLTSVAGAERHAPPVRPSRPNMSRRRMVVVVAIVIAVICVAGLVWAENWPFTQKSVVENLAEASDSTVTIGSFHATYFPSPGCILEGVRFVHGPGRLTLITIEKVVIEGSYLGILSRHVARVTTTGGHVFIPPFGSNVTFHSQHSKVVIDEMRANGTSVDFASDDPQKSPVRFDVREALLADVQWEKPIRYRLKFENPKPPGEIAVQGSFGAWADGHHEDTPLSGEYSFDHADLGVYGGIAGTLSSKGKFGGVLKHVDITGTTEVPDFEVTSGGHKVSLATQFEAYVDATHGDTFLKHVEARWGRTTVIAEGSVAGSEGQKGKAAVLRLSARQSRIEDILGLFVSTPHSPMSGALAFATRAEIAPGGDPFLERVKLGGTFGIDDGSFSKADTQNRVDELSAGARGDKMEDAATVLTDLKGNVDLERGVAHFSDLSFGVPGAAARMFGTFNIVNHKIDLHGRMRVDSKISKTATGVKSVLLKMMDPFFKKKKKGEIVSVHIAGTYEKPEFGLDLTRKQDQTPAAK